MKLLIVEDNPDIVANLYGFFEPLGYVLDNARDGFSGLARAAEGDYDAVVLDLGLPGLDGLALCRRLRQELRRPIPVIILTARDTLEDKVAGLESGADDYLVKPFSMLELDARLKALVRRASAAYVNTVLRVGELAFDTASFEVSRAGRSIVLTPSAYKLLAALMRTAPRLSSRQALERELWGEEAPESDALRTHIHSLRQSLDKPFAHPMLLTVHGLGYRLVDPDAD